MIDTETEAPLPPTFEELLAAREAAGLVARGMSPEEAAELANVSTAVVLSIRGRVQYMPTPADIAKVTKRIRRGWSAATRAGRNMRPDDRVPWTVPEIFDTGLSSFGSSADS